MASFKIDTFQNGINEYLAEGLIKPNESVNAYNCNISNGSLKTFNDPKTVNDTSGYIHSLTAYYGNSNSFMIHGTGLELKTDEGNVLHTISGSRLDFLNFEYKGEKILVGSSLNDIPFIFGSGGTRLLKNRRPKYNDEGALEGYIDANGTFHNSESTITTYAPKGDFIELHYDRLWIAGNPQYPDRLYFSTAGQNGADIEDFTVPLAEEEEINMHGGFIDVRSYDGSRIIGMKTIFNSIVVFKEKSAYKVYGSSPSNYQMVQIFSCNGAIADRSIVAGNNGAYFLNSDGIYFFDGTNTTLVSQKISSMINRINKSLYWKIAGVFYNNKYYLSVPIDGSSENNIVIEYDVINNSFMYYNIWNITRFLEYQNKMYCSVDTDIKLLFEGITPLTLKWETPNIDFDFKNSRKRSEYIYFRAKGNGNIKFTLITERNTKSIEVPLTSTETLYKKKIKVKGRMMKLIIENVNNSSFELTSPEIIVEIEEE